jgi:hypothetical protein
MIRGENKAKKAARKELSQQVVQARELEREPSKAIKLLLAAEEQLN